MSETYKIKQIGRIEYYIGKFKSKNGEIQYGIHARDSETKKPMIEAVYVAGLCDTPEEAETAFIKWYSKENKNG